MSEELIREYVDLAAIKAQTDVFLDNLARVKAKYEELQKSKIEIQSSRTFTDASKVAQQAEKEAQAAIRTQKELVALKQQQIKLENELLKQAALQEKQAQAALKLQKSKVETVSVTNASAVDEQTGALKKQGTVVSNLDRIEAEAAISATAYGQSHNQAAKIVKEKTASNKALIITEKEIALALAQDKLLAQQAAAALKNQVREEIAVKGSLEQRRAALIRLNAVYDNQSPIERSSASGQRLQKIISGLTTQVQTLEVNTGRAQRNVGNYGSAFDKVKEGAGKAFSALRTIANILPGIGIGTVFLLGYEAIVKVIDALAGVNNKLFTYAQQRELMNTVSEEASKTAGREVAQLKILRAEIEDTNLPMATRLQAIKDIKKEYPEYFKGLTNEELLTGKVGAAYNLAADAILRKARANAAASEIEQIEAKKLAIFQKSQDDRQEAIDNIRKAKDETIVTGGRGDRAGQLRTNSAEAQRKGIKLRYNAQVKADQEEIDLLNKKEDFLLKFALNGAKETVKIDGIKADNNQKSLKKLSDQQSTAFEQFKLEQERYLDLINEGVNDENNSFETRISQLQHYTYQRKVLINAQEENDIQAIRNKLAIDIDNLNKEKKKGADIEGINKEIEIITYNANQKIELIEKKSQIERLKANDDFFKRKQAIVDFYAKESEKKAKDAAKKEAEGKIQEGLDEEKELEIRKSRVLKFLDLIQSYWDKVSGVISGAFNIGATRRKNDIQQAIDDIEKQRDADLKANDARVQSEEQKAANIAIINSRAEQQKRQQEQRQKQVERQQAQSEKALSIFSITLSIAKAVASHLGKPWLIALDIALGAAQLAVAAATPIPRFKHGKKASNKYSGPAIVNDGTKLEVLEREDGSIEFPEGRDVLTNVGKNDIIHPDRDVWMNTILGAAHRDAVLKTPGGSKTDTGIMSAMQLQTKLLKQIASKPALKLSSTEGGMRALWSWGANQTKYIDQNTNW